MRPTGEGLLVRYWAGAKAAAGTPQEFVPITDSVSRGRPSRRSSCWTNITTTPRARAAELHRR